MNSLVCWFCICARGLVLFQICLSYRPSPDLQNYRKQTPRTYLSFKHWLVLSVIDRCVNCIHAVWPLWGPLKFFHTKQNSYCADKRIYVFIFLAGTAARQSTMLQWHQWRNVPKKKKKKKKAEEKKGHNNDFQAQTWYITINARSLYIIKFFQMVKKQPFPQTIFGYS